MGVTDSVGLARVPSGKAGRSATSSRLAGVRQSHAGRKGGRRPGDACARKEYPRLHRPKGGAEADAAEPCGANSYKPPPAPRKLSVS